MSRPLRINYENAWYHVMNRGARKETIFGSDSDRLMFLDLLENIHDRHGIEIHAFCLMGNHYHLLLRTPEGNLPQAMRTLNGVYTQRFNRRHEFDGPLFRGRYLATLIQDDSYLTTVSRYVHRNPVEARLVDSSAQYRWSSIHDYRSRTPRRWVTTSDTLVYFEGQRRLFVEFVDGPGKSDEVIDQIRRSEPVAGDREFRRRVAHSAPGDTALNPSISRIIARPRLAHLDTSASVVFKVDRAVIHTGRNGRLNLARLAAIGLASELSGETLATIASHYGLASFGTVSSRTYAMRERERTDFLFAQKVECIRQRVSLEIAA